MDNSTFDKYDKFLFNITGDTNKTKEDIECTINNITSQNYILIWKSNETFKSYFIAIIIPIIFVIGLILILLAYFRKKEA